MKKEYSFFFSLWFDNQEKKSSKGLCPGSLDPKGKTIALDPGVRKFLVGYDGEEMIFIGKRASKVIASLLLQIDKEENRNKRMKLRREIKNKVDELHWKTISFLISNYDTILLPSFEVSKMVRGKRLPRIVKRMMLSFSFYKFKERLKWKGSLYDKKIHIVDESYTSKTCTCCGCLNDVGSKETYICSKCGLEIDRDVNGARNIYIKNIDLIDNKILR